MHRNDLPAWTAKTQRTNASITLQTGMRVRSFVGAEGTITSITLPEVMPGDAADHGSIAIQGTDGELHHYTYTQWRTQLRVLPDTPAPEKA